MNTNYIQPQESIF